MAEGEITQMGELAMGSLAGIRNQSYQNPMNNYAGSIILLTNPDNELYQLELTLRNLLVDAKGNPRPTGEPLVNEQGLASIMGMTKTIVSQITVMSNVEDKEIKTILMEFLGDTLAKDLMMNRVRYNITDPTARDKIYYNVMNISFMCAKRAMNEGERRFWKGSQQEITTRIEGANPKKKGLLGGMLGWGK